jgi:histo-blood group ABO system transferase
MAKIALCCIATNDYVDFLPNLLKSADKYFLIGHEVHYIIFTNRMETHETIETTRYERWINIDHEPWPMMTLKRYHFMSDANLSLYDYCYYVDCDSLFVAPVGDEIFGELVGVQHPGFYRGGGSWEDNQASQAFVYTRMRKQYIAGGFQGGSDYCMVMPFLMHMIDEDEKTGNRAKWNDESHWNALFAYSPNKFTILDPSYCMVEEPEKRKAWGIDHFEPKIIALAKDHKKYQK